MEILKDSLEFVELQKNVKIKFSQAEKKFDEFHNKNKYSELEKVFYFYKEGFYYFGFKTNPYNDKQNRSLFFYELKINSSTGEMIPIEGQK